MFLLLIAANQSYSELSGKKKKKKVFCIPVEMLYSSAIETLRITVHHTSLITNLIRIAAVLGYLSKGKLMI